MCTPIGKACLRKRWLFILLYAGVYARQSFKLTLYLGQCNYCYNIKFSFSKNEGMPSQEMYKAVNADGQTWCGADEAVWLCSAAFCPLDVTGSLLAVSLSPSAQLLPWEVGWGTCCRQQVECKQGSCPNSELVLC